MPEHEIEGIVTKLTSKLYCHGHPINRDEAKQMGLRVEDGTPEIERAMWALFEEYERDMDLLGGAVGAPTVTRLA